MTETTVEIGTETVATETDGDHVRLIIDREEISNKSIHTRRAETIVPENAKSAMAEDETSENGIETVVQDDETMTGRPVEIAICSMTAEEEVEVAMIAQAEKTGMNSQSKREREEVHRQRNESLLPI